MTILNLIECHLRGWEQDTDSAKSLASGHCFVTQYVLSSNDEVDAVNILQGDAQKEGDIGSPMKQSRDEMIVAGAGGVFHFGEVAVLGEPVFPTASLAQCREAHPVDCIITTCICYVCCSQFSCLGANLLEVIRSDLFSMVLFLSATENNV